MGDVGIAADSVDEVDGADGADVDADAASLARDGVDLEAVDGVEASLLLAEPATGALRVVDDGELQALELDGPLDLRLQQ